MVSARADGVSLLSGSLAPAAPGRAIYFGAAEGYGDCTYIENIHSYNRARALAKRDAFFWVDRQTPFQGQYLIPQARIISLDMESQKGFATENKNKITARVKTLVFAETSNPQAKRKLQILLFRAMLNKQIALEISMAPEEVWLRRTSASGMSLRLDPKTAQRIRSELVQNHLSPALITGELAAIPEGHNVPTAAVPLSVSRVRNLLQVPRAHSLIADVKSCLSSLTWSSN